MDVSANTIMTINVVILICFMLFLWSGYRQGFLMKLINIIGFFVVGVLSWWLSGPLSNIIGLYPKNSLPLQGTIAEQFLYENFNRFMVFVVLFVVLNIALLLIKPILKVIAGIPVVSTVNKVFGSILGGIQALLLLFVVTLILRMPLIANGSQLVEQSWLKYSEPLMDVMLFYVKDPMKQLNVMFDMIDQTKTLTRQEVADIREWLLLHGMEEEKVDAMIATLRTE